MLCISDLYLMITMSNSPLCSNNYFLNFLIYFHVLVLILGGGPKPCKRANDVLRPNLIYEANIFFNLWLFVGIMWTLQGNGDEAIFTNSRRPHRMKPGLKDWGMASNNKVSQNEAGLKKWGQHYRMTRQPHRMRRASQIMPHRMGMASQKEVGLT